MFKEIFTNDITKEKVRIIHGDLKEMYKGMTLLEIMAAGYFWEAEKLELIKVSGKLKEICDFMYRWDYKNGEERLADFGLHNTIEVQNTKHRAIFLQRMSKLDWAKDLFTSPKISVKDLEKLSWEAYNYPTIAFAIKFYVLAHGLEEEYAGIQSLTKPVKTATYKLFGVGDEETQPKHTMRCAIIADKIKKNQTYVNTVFYLLGL